MYFAELKQPNESPYIGKGTTPEKAYKELESLYGHLGDAAGKVKFYEAKPIKMVVKIVFEK